MSKPDPPTVVDEIEHHRFAAEQDGLVAELIYHLNGDRLVLIHTEVPPPLGGRGIGGSLVRAAVERAARDGLTLVPRCPYARQWLQDHREVADTVAIDWSTPPEPPGRG